MSAAWCWSASVRQAQQEFFGTFKDPAFAEDGLEDDGAGVGVDRGVQRFDIILLDKGHTFEHRLKAFAIFVLSGKGHRAKGPPVIRTLQRHQLALGIATGLVSGEPRQLDRAFHGLRAAVREKNAIKSRKLAQPLGKLSLIFVVVEIRKVNDPGGLFADCLSRCADEHGPAR